MNSLELIAILNAEFQSVSDLDDAVARIRAEEMVDIDEFDRDTALSVLARSRQLMVDSSEVRSDAEE